MERFNSVRALNYALILSAAFVVTSATFIQNCQALTASSGQPYRGRLENGVPFPNCFPGYQLREESRTFTTPEVIGALLDAIEAVRTKFPETCDLYIGDFSMPGGGSAGGHRSHQNGRDVDLGMYAKGNRKLDGFISMNEDNLDAAKTWCLVEALINSQRVQYIFLDRRVQQVLYDHAVTLGYDQAYLHKVFGNVRGSYIQHVRNHHDHIHVRFFTPWSTLAAHIGDGESDKRMVIEMAQQSYLPKKVNYFVNSNDTSLDELARSFGVTKRELCKWNRLNPSGVPIPGSCLVFYKRSFESEPVNLARSLQPGFIAQAPAVRMASVRAEQSEQRVADAVARAPEPPRVHEKKVERHEPASKPVFYTVKRGDTLKVIAKRNNVEMKLLCQLNGIKETTPLRPGQALKVGSKMYADAGKTATDASRKSGSSSSSAICFTADPKKPNSPTAAYYTVGKGDTLSRISRKSGISIDVLCQLNGMKRNSGLQPGQRIKLTQATLAVKPALGSSACSPKSLSKAAIKEKASSKKSGGKADAKTNGKAVQGKKVNKAAPAAKVLETKSKSAATRAKVAVKPVSTPAVKDADRKPAKTTEAKAAGKPANTKGAMKIADRKPVKAEAKAAGKGASPSVPKKRAEKKSVEAKADHKKASNTVGQLAKGSPARR